MVNYYCGCYDLLQYPLLFPYRQNSWHCGIEKIKPIASSTTTQIYCEHEQLPSVKNMTSIDGFLNLENDILRKDKRKKDDFLS